MKNHATLNRISLIHALRRCSAGVAMTCLFADIASAGSLTTLLSQIQAAPANSWIQIKTTNQFPFATGTSNPVSVPQADTNSQLGSYATNSAGIVYAWSSFAWDSNRGDLIFWGGGHANYSGNEIYRWKGATQTWERDSLPSYLQQSPVYSAIQPYIPFGDIASPYDGSLYAPVSAHTYDNQLYLPVADRFVTFGGGGFETGGPFLKQIVTGAGINGLFQTGPYFFNPALADGTKVGGITGSGVDPTVLGGNMWQNRDIYFDSNGIPKSPSLLDEANPETVIGTTPTGYPYAGSLYENGDALVHVNGTTDYVFRNQQESIYFTASPAGGGTSQNLYILTLTNYNNPALDVFEAVGIDWRGAGGQGAGAYDPVHNLYIKTVGSDFGGRQPWFTFWDLNPAGPGTTNTGPGPGNENVEVHLNTGNFPTGFSELGQYGFEYDHVRNQFLLWNGVGQVLSLQVILPSGCIPTNNTNNCTNDTSNWTLTDQQAAAPTGGALPTNVAPFGFTGVLGKWHYARNLDVFVALDTTANVWFYKPNGWVVPGDLNNDGKVTQVDQISFIQTLGKSTGMIGFNVKADYDYDGAVTLRDYQLWSTYFSNAN